MPCGSLYDQDSPVTVKTPFSRLIHSRLTLLSLETVRAYLYWTEAMINELPLLHRPSPNNSGPGWIDFGRAECFHACVEASRHFIDNWFHFDHYEIFGMFMGLGLHFAQATHMIYRLSMAPTGGTDAGWDRQNVRDAIDLPRTLIQGAEKFSEVSEVLGLEVDDGELDPYILTGMGLKAAATQWEKTFEDTDARRTAVSSVGGVATRSGEAAGAPTGMPTGVPGYGGVDEGAAGGAADGEDLPMIDFSAGFWMPDMFDTWNSV